MTNPTISIDEIEVHNAMKPLAEYLSPKATASVTKQISLGKDKDGNKVQNVSYGLNITIPENDRQALMKLQTLQGAGVIYIASNKGGKVQATLLNLDSMKNFVHPLEEPATAANPSLPPENPGTTITTTTGKPEQPRIEGPTP